MSNPKNSSVLRYLFLTVTILSFIVSTPVRAEGPPENLDNIQALVADSTLLRDKVVYVDFWASWCLPCRQSFPWMQGIYKKYHGQGFEVVAVNVDKDHRSAVKFLDDNEASFTILFDSTGALAGDYRLEAMPSSYLYGRDGRLVTQKQGFHDDETDEIDAAIRELLIEEKPQ